MMGIPTHTLDADQRRMAGLPDLARAQRAKRGTGRYAQAKHRALEGMRRTRLHFAFAHAWSMLYPDLPFVEEYRFHPTRRWRFDLAWPAVKVAVEMQGAVWTAGGHTRGVGYHNDRDKREAAEALGWRVFYRTATDMRQPVRACEAVAEAIRSRIV
jgi:hypothetical protein